MCARESPRRKYIHRQRLNNVVSFLVFHAMFIQPHKEFISCVRSYYKVKAILELTM